MTDDEELLEKADNKKVIVFIDRLIDGIRDQERDLEKRPTRTAAAASE